MEKTKELMKSQDIFTTVLVVMEVFMEEEVVVATVAVTCLLRIGPSKISTHPKNG